jgi:uncharacterized protein DUF4157
MVAQKVAKPRTKAPASSTNPLEHKRSTSVATQSIGNQASLGILALHASNLTANSFVDHQELAVELDPRATRGPSWDFSKTPLFPLHQPSGSHFPSPLFAQLIPAILQRKLIVGEVNDPLEHEADQVVDHVMRISDGELSVGVAPMQISRKCADCGCADCEEEKKLQRKEIGPQAHTAEAPALVHGVLRSPGRPLDAATRAYFEPRFRYDFSRVRIHTDETAGRSAFAIAAKAYAVGRHVVFGPGRYTPESQDGRRLLAHELAHVVQQTNREVIARQIDPAKPSKTPTASKTVFHPGVMHNHQPSGRWADVQKNPDSGFGIESVCRHSSPGTVLTLAKATALYGNPIAIAHLNWYLNGGGKDFIEDDNLELMLRTDAGVQDKITKSIPSGTSTGIFSGHVVITQDNYSSDEFKNSFGEIDRLDFEVDFAAGTIHAWFQDRYEWHPVYSFYKQMPGDFARPTNCVHAAAVELKSEGAKDYWMKGEMPFKVIPLAASYKAPPTPPSAVL